MRVACLRVPDLPLVAALRAEPHLAGKAFAVAEGEGPRAALISVSPEARALGVRPGQSLAQARTLAGVLVLRTRMPALLDTARGTLLDVALSFSPRAELAPPGQGPWSTEAAVFLDASGTGALFPSEAAFATALSARAARLGLPARVSVAGSRAVARLVARAPAAPDAVHVLAPGREAAWLAPLPLDLLDPPDALAQAFTRFGLRRVGDLARLPRDALATRLGPAALALAALARGEGETHPVEPVRDTTVEEAIDLEAPLERLEPLAFVLRGLLSRLSDRLEARGLAAGGLDLALGLAGGGRESRRVGFAARHNDVRTWLRLVQLSLESTPPRDAVEHVRVRARGEAARSDQLDLFRPAGPAPAVMDRTLAELESLCGAGRVGAPALADDHRVDAFSLVPFAPPRAPDPPAVSGDGFPTQALRALRPPLAARVRVEAGRPAELRSAVANGRVLGCAGPWRTTGRWWSPEERFAHDHFDVRTSDGTVSRLRHDLVHGRWQVDGVYD